MSELQTGSVQEFNPPDPHGWSLQSTEHTHRAPGLSHYLGAPKANLHKTHTQLLGLQTAEVTV